MADPTLISRRALLQGACGTLFALGFLPRAEAAASAQLAVGDNPFDLPFRHIHLDFHTSSAVPGVGSDFQAQDFARTLREAAVNSITVFAKCHHGNAYYPTKVGVRHPSLRNDLLGEMIEACHAEGIRVPVYISVGYDQRMWARHGDWRALDSEGRQVGHRGGAGPLKAALGTLCLNTAYFDYLAAQAEEVVSGYEADGIFYDNFVHPAPGCFCAACMAERETLGMDSARPEDCVKHSEIVIDRVIHRLFDIVRSRKPKISVFVNGPLGMRRGTPEFRRSLLKYYSHVEIESLPGALGYTYFQIASRYMRTLGLAVAGMTGSFHRSWGDFGSIRNQAALDYECFQMLAQATTCSIGDHLQPSGRLHESVYERIGKTFRSVAEKEPWCTGARAVTEIGCLLSDGNQESGESDAGLVGMLTQLHHQFDMLDAHSDFGKYRLIILPDDVRLNERLRQKVETYLGAGGKLVLSHEAGLDDAGKRFALSGLGLEYEGAWPHEVQYLEVLDPLTEGIPEMVHVAYDKGSAVKARPGTRVLARVWGSYFDRDFRRFHVEQSPFSGPTEYVAVAARDNVIYLAVPIFRSYARNGYAFYRQLVANCIQRLMPDQLVKASVPSTAQVSITEQQGRRIVHILNYIPERRAPNLDVVEDVIPLFDVELSVRSEGPPRQIYLAPQRNSLAFTYGEGYAKLVVPSVAGHQMVVLET
jgi:hypothetical protein